MPSRIEWTDQTWNPVTGCSPVSEGCANCYAKRMAHRLKAMGVAKYRNDFAVTCHPETLDEPLHWRKPRRVFVCSMSDLFHEDVPLDLVAAIYAVMMFTPWHTYQVLTKRPERAAGFLQWLIDEGTTRHYLDPLQLAIVSLQARSPHLPRRGNQHAANEWYLANCDQSDRGKCDLPVPWPLPNLWLGVTAENQKTADERIPLLLQTPAAVRFVSIEPMLGPVDLRLYLPPPLDQERDAATQRWLGWVILGAETGPGKRPMELDWARRVRDDCQAAGVPFFFKRDSNGSRLLDGRKWEQYPERTT